MCSPNFRLIRKLINPNRKVRKAKTTLQILKHSIVTSDLWVFSLKALFTIQNLITLQPFKNQGDHMSLLSHILKQCPTFSLVLQDEHFSKLYLHILVFTQCHEGKAFDYNQIAYSSGNIENYKQYRSI